MASNEQLLFVIKWQKTHGKAHAMHAKNRIKRIKNMHCEKTVVTYLYNSIHKMKPLLCLVFSL